MVYHKENKPFNLSQIYLSNVLEAHAQKGSRGPRVFQTGVRYFVNCFRYMKAITTVVVDELERMFY